MFCAPKPIFDSTEGVGSRFHVLRSRTRFRRYRGRRVPFSCVALPEPFLTVPRASGLIFMFCAPRLNFGGTEGVGFRFHVLRSRNRFRRYRCIGSRYHVMRSLTHFRRYRGRRVRFSCLALQDSISAVPRASGSVFMFCAPGLIFGDTDGVESRFYVLRSRTYFRRYRGRQVPFSCFTLPDPFFAVPTASVPVFLFCAPGPILGGTDGVGSRFHVLRSRMHFRRCRGRRVSFLSFALHDSFSTVPRASGLVYLFCAPGPIFDGTNDVGSRFDVLRSRTHFRRF
jgi:hypothetical protein